MSTSKRSLRTFGVRLWALLGFVIVVTAIAAFLFSNVLDQARIGGERYREIVAIQDLEADVTMPELTLVEAQVALQSLALAEETTPVPELPGISELEASFAARYEGLLADTTDPEVRSALIDANQAAQDYFTEVEGDFTLAAAAGDRKMMRALLAGPIAEKYAAHAESIDQVARLADAQALAAERSARQALRADKRQLLLVGIGLGLLGVTLTAFTLRSLSSRLRGMRHAASKEFPKLVAHAAVTAEAGGERASYAAPAIRGRDEMARTERALHRVIGSAVEIAADQGSLRYATSEMFTYHGRRNHKLVTASLDEVAALEQGLDHERSARLTQLRTALTRLRLRADGMLVVAGAPAMRSFEEPVTVERVIDVALADGDPANGDRVRVDLVAAGPLAGDLGADLAHLVAELVDNALVFSPSDVLIEGRPDDEGYALVVSDDGLGIDGEALVNYNDLLAHGEVDLQDSRRMGFSVVARLAFRHDLSVSLSHKPTGGLQARVWLPASALGTDAVKPGDTGTETVSLEVGPAVEESTPAAIESSTYLPRRIRGASLDESLRELPATVIVPERRDPEVVRSSLAALAIGQQAASEYQEDHVDEQE